MLRKVLLLVVLVSVHLLSGQDSGSMDLSQMSRELGNLMRDVERDGGAANGLETKGSPFLDAGFKKMDIVAENADVSVAYGRYNAFADRIEMKLGPEEEDIYVLTQSPEVSCVLNGRHYYYKDYVADDGRRTGYLQVLTEDGFYTLYKRVYVYYREGKVVADPLKSDVPNKYVQQESLLVASNGNPPEEVKMKKKQLMEVLSADHAKVTKALLNKGGYNLKRENELVDFFEQLNALIAEQ